MGKRSIAPLVNGRVRLRLLEETDLPLTLAWRNQDHIREWFFHSDVISPAQHRAWWERYRDRDDDFVFIIEEIEVLKRPVGQLAIYHVDRAAGRAEFGRLMIGIDEARGLGLARLATTALVDHALTAWSFQEVYLEVRADNWPAIRVYHAAGFTESARHTDRLIMHRRSDDTSARSPQPS
jgi:RimJ/RimL family protein N-acetyltransferase